MSIRLKINPNERALQLLDYGLDITPNASKHLKKGIVCETPSRLNNAIIKGDSFFGAFTYASSGLLNNVEIGRYCSIAAEVNIGQFNHPTTWMSTNPFQYQKTFRINVGQQFKYKDEYDSYEVNDDLNRLSAEQVRKKTIIGNDVWIGYRAIIVSGVKIGDGAIIGAGAVVTKDIPPFSIAVGVPAKVIKYRFDELLRLEFEKVQWWNYPPWKLVNIDFSEPAIAIENIRSLSSVGDLGSAYSGLKLSFTNDEFTLEEEE